MPLLEKARVEVYLPDLPRRAYRDLLDELAQEFTYTFGGCTIVHGLEGNYLSHAGAQIRDRISLIYTDTPYKFTQHLETITDYIDKLKAAVFAALAEEAVLVVVTQVYHGD